MCQAACEAIEQTWAQTVKARALCPWTDSSAEGKVGYHSPPWYVQHGAAYFVNLAEPLRSNDIREMNEIAMFINRSFVVSVAAILEALDIVPHGENPDLSRKGGNPVQLTKWLRNRFAHGEYLYDDGIERHRKTRTMLEQLFPTAAAEQPGFALAIDKILEPLKNGVLDYIPGDAL